MELLKQCCIIKRSDIQGGKKSVTVIYGMQFYLTHNNNYNAEDLLFKQKLIYKITLITLHFALLADSFLTKQHTICLLYHNNYSS